jgi:hypothetical protein
LRTAVIYLNKNVSHGIILVSAGRRRLHRFLQGLKATSSAAAHDLLLTVTAAQPKLAAAYLGSAPLLLEPRPSLRWWAGMSLTAHLVQQAAALPLPFAEQACRSAAQPHYCSPYAC